MARPYFRAGRHRFHYKHPAHGAYTVIAFGIRAYTESDNALRESGETILHHL